jgi:hypothetical protein
LVLSPTASINLGFKLREDLLLCSSYLPLGVPNWAVIYTLSSITAKTTIAPADDRALSLPLISMELVTLPLSLVHNIIAEGMEFTIMKTLRASMVEMWLHTVKQRFLSAAPIKCVGLDCEFTSPHEGRIHQRATVLQLSVASEVLVFQICRADSCATAAQGFLEGPH